MPHINERVAAADGLVVEDAVQNVQCKRSRTSSLGRYRPADIAYDVRMGLLSLRPPPRVRWPCCQAHQARLALGTELRCVVKAAVTLAAIVIEI